MCQFFKQKIGIIKQECLVFYTLNIENGVKSIVKKQSAGNLMFKSAVKKESEVSVHIGKHRRPENETDLGYYLAGLIEGQGSSNSEQGATSTHTLRFTHSNRTIVDCVSIVRRESV